MAREKTGKALLRGLRRGAALVVAGAVLGALAQRAGWLDILPGAEETALALVAWELRPISLPAEETALPLFTETGGEAEVLAEAPAAERDEPLLTPSPTPQPEEEIVEQTLLPGTSSHYVSADGVYVYNYTGYEVDLAALAAEGLDLTLTAGAPQVLIIHTHSTEAYTQAGEDCYAESGDHRATDSGYNMLRVGNEAARVLREAGLEVIHDTGIYDYPNYNGAYDRSGEAIRGWLERYPTIQVVLDLHRDALTAADGAIYKTAAQVEGEKAAQVMLVVGTDAGGASHSGWRKNLTLAVALQSALNEKYPTLARPIALRSSRFNQHLTPGSLLVEVGSHGNTLQEALTAARLLAGALAEVLEPMVESGEWRVESEEWR